jgi:hypothetical protein
VYSGIDPTGKIRFWLWEVSEMIVAVFRMCHLLTSINRNVDGCTVGTAEGCDLRSKDRSLRQLLQV